MFQAEGAVCTKARGSCPYKDKGRGQRLDTPGLGPGPLPSPSLLSNSVAPSLHSLTAAVTVTVRRAWCCNFISSRTQGHQRLAESLCAPGDNTPTAPYFLISDSFPTDNRRRALGNQEVANRSFLGCCILACRDRRWGRGDRRPPKRRRGAGK